jgi:phage terminase small subunit
VANPRKPLALKIIGGTDQPCRRSPDPGVDLPLVDAIPDAPDWLPNMHAAKEWNRLAPMLYASRLLTEAALVSLGHLCALHGKIVQLYTAGEAPPASMIAQHRALSNDFGLTPASRGKVVPAQSAKESNRFANNGRRK